MHVRVRDFAAALAFLALAFGLFAAGMGGTTDPGITFETHDGLVFVKSVAPFSPAANVGVEAGAVVYQAGYGGGTAADAFFPTSVDESSVTYLELIDPSQVAAARALPTKDPTGAYGPYANLAVYGVWLGGPDQERQGSLAAVTLGLVLLILGIAWLTSGAAGAEMRALAITLPVAMATPLLLLPWILVPHPVPALSGAAIQVLAVLPLAADMADRAWPGAPAWRRYAIPVAFAALALALAAGPFLGMRLAWARILSGGMAAGAVFAPGLLAGWPALSSEAGTGSAPRARHFVESAELVMAATAPGAAVLSTVPGMFAWPIVLWVVVFLGVRRFTLRPLARLVTRTAIQRDAIVAATEAERARIAADIHDDALQDLTMLIRRLDAAGDRENAEAAREVAARLRAICGELRLPILDDLGVGPALEWLTERFEPLAGGPLYLERLREEPRLPRDVELALFRICQEALTNSVKHGKPPIVVRYRSGGRWAELEVDDSGPGIPAGSADRAVDAGHFGLLNMAQRAEQVGASLTLGRRPGGGTRVSVAWEAAAAAVGVSAEEAPTMAPVIEPTAGGQAIEPGRA